MAIDIKTPSFVINASATSSQRVQLTSGQTCTYVRIANASTSALAFVTAGNSTVAATSNNIAVAPGLSRTFIRNKNTDTYVAALLSSGTGIVSVTPVDEDSAI